MYKQTSQGCKGGFRRDDRRVVGADRRSYPEMARCQDPELDLAANQGRCRRQAGRIGTFPGNQSRVSPSRLGGRTDKDGNGEESEHQGRNRNGDSQPSRLHAPDVSGYFWPTPQAEAGGDPWSRSAESNRGPTHYECVALPTELLRRPRHCIDRTAGHRQPR